MPNADASPQLRLVLSLISAKQDPPLPRVPPRQRTRISARPANGALDIERIFISGSTSPGGAADWIVNDVEIDGRSQLTQKDLPGALFASSGIAASHRAATSFSFQGFDPVERDRELAIIVTYVGPHPEGAPFSAAALGKRPQQRPTVVPIATREPLAPATTTTITARLQNGPFQIDRLEIDDGPDWLVEDLRVDGRSQFSQPGPIPGDMFASNAIDTFVTIDLCPAGSALEIDVTYVGSRSSGANFVARLEGTVPRSDDAIAPPDLHVIVATGGQGFGDAVTGTCDWRPPATDARYP